MELRRLRSRLPPPIHPRRMSSMFRAGANISSSNWVTVLEYIGVGLLIAGAVVGGVLIAEKLSGKKGG